MRAILAGSLLAMLLIPAVPQPAASGLDPAGKWTFSTKDEDGTSLNGTMEITGHPGSYKGTANIAGMDQALPITDVATAGNMFIMLATTGDGGTAVVKIWKSADGKVQGTWGPLKQMMPVTLEKTK